MAYDYSVAVTLFPGSVAPDDWGEFIGRVNDDPGITTAALEDLELRFATKDPLVLALRFDVEPTVGEKAIIDALAAASPDGESSSVARFLADFDGAEHRGRDQDYGVDTVAAGGIAVRNSHTATLTDGVFRITWLATADGSSGGNQHSARFIFDRGGADEFIYELGPTFGPVVLSGQTFIALDAGTYDFELEIEDVSGGGDALMRASELSYEWVGPTPVAPA